MRGHIRKRSKDSWSVVVSIGRDPRTGKRKQLWRTVRGTKREAEAQLVQILHQHETGVDMPPGRVTLGDFLDKWLSSHAEPNTAPKTFIRYEQLVRVHLKPALGSVLLSKLRPLQVQDAYNEIKAKGLSNRTVLHCHRVLRQALQHAVKWGMLTRNPTDAVDAPRPKRFEVNALRPDQARQLQEAADETRYGSLIRTAMTTGLRQGELLGLRWKDVDLDARVLSVRQTCQWLPHEGFVFRVPKSDKSIRAVTLPDSAVDALRRHRASQLAERLAAGPAYTDFDLVFADPVGRPTNISTLRKHWLILTAGVGLSGFRFHDLRHTHASLLLQQGVHAKVVSERLGHATTAITMDIYSHVAPGLQVDAARRFDEVLANG